MRTARNTWKTYVLGGVAVAALLSSTGCQESDTSQGAGAPAPSSTSVSDGPSGAGSPSASSSATPVDGGDGGGSTETARTPAGEPPATSAGSGSGGSGSGGSGGSGSGSGGSGSRARTTACTDENISVTSRAEPHDELRHLTLTATNIGDRTCTLYKYALIRFDEGSYDEVGPLESNANAVATLAPGQKAYAGMRLFVAGEETRAVKTLTLGFQGRDSADEIGSPVDVPLPGDVPFLNIGPTPGVTFWDTDLKSVQRFTFAR
ncbi:DUF4232 domain-containing protein [Streptomyces sp. NPDC004284]|uniref:DUF4232 domain-containing protein n=1 Tax=Streptomyces sp. NPDC004284 TaxID=3364695 RepID=UPI0036B54186